MKVYKQIGSPPSRQANAANHAKIKRTMIHWDSLIKSMGKQFQNTAPL